MGPFLQKWLLFEHCVLCISACWAWSQGLSLLVCFGGGTAEAEREAGGAQGPQQGLLDVVVVWTTLFPPLHPVASHFPLSLR